MKDLPFGEEDDASLAICSPNHLVPVEPWRKTMIRLIATPKGVRAQDLRFWYGGAGCRSGSGFLIDNSGIVWLATTLHTLCGSQAWHSLAPRIEAGLLLLYDQNDRIAPLDLWDGRKILIPSHRDEIIDAMLIEIRPQERPAGFHLFSEARLRDPGLSEALLTSKFWARSNGVRFPLNEGQPAVACGFMGTKLKSGVAIAARLNHLPDMPVERSWLTGFFGDIAIGMSGGPIFTAAGDELQLVGMSHSTGPISLWNRDQPINGTSAVRIEVISSLLLSVSSLDWHGIRVVAL